VPTCGPILALLNKTPRSAFHLVIIGSILTGCSRCLRMILLMICEEAVYTLANLGSKKTSIETN